MLHPIRAGVPDLFGDRPAVHPRQPCQQALEESAGTPTRLDPRKPARDPTHQLIQALPPPVGVYAVARGHRKIICCLHKLGSSERWASRTPDRHANSMITIYGWSTRPPGSHLGGPGLRRRHGELVALDEVREPFGLRHWDFVAVRELDDLRHFCFAALNQADYRPKELFESGR